MYFCFDSTLLFVNKMDHKVESKSTKHVNNVKKKVTFNDNVIVHEISELYTTNMWICNNEIQDNYDSMKKLDDSANNNKSSQSNNDLSGNV